MTHIDPTPSDDDYLSDPATQVALDIHSVDGALAHIRRVFNEAPYLAAAFRDDLAEIGSEFTQLAHGGMQ